MSIQTPRSPGAPTFFIIGAAKSGTTALHHYMGQHPDVFFADPKEPWFFHTEIANGLDWYRERYFGGWTGQPAVGEAGGKMFPPYVADRLADSYPDAQLIALLREPVERAHSHWWMNVSRGREPLSFGEAVEENLRRLVAGPSFDGPEGEQEWLRYVAALENGRLLHRVYLDLGLYAAQLSRFLARFPESQLHVLDYDALRTDAGGVARQMLAKVGVDPDRVRLDVTPQNVAGTRRQLGVYHSVRRLARRVTADRLLPTGAKAWVRDRLSTRASQPALAQDVRNRLERFYQEPNRRLAELLGNAAPAWCRTRS